MAIDGTVESLDSDDDKFREKVEKMRLAGGDKWLSFYGDMVADKVSKVNI